MILLYDKILQMRARHVNGGHGAPAPPRQPLRHESRAGTSLPATQSSSAAAPGVGLLRRNPFNHPTPEVVERLGQAGARIYRIDRDGVVLLDTDGAALRITRWARRDTETLRLASIP